MVKIGYARVSSKNQKLDRQLEALQDCEKIFSDKLSGASLNREGLNQLLAFIREGDIVVVLELDRLGRNNIELTDTMNKIQQAGATLEVLTLPTTKGIEDENLRRLINNLMIELYKYQAENERQKIRERQQQGIEIAKRNGKFKGRKPRFTLNDPHLLHAIQLHVEEDYSIKEIERLTKIPENTFRRYLKKYLDQKRVN